MKEAPLHVDALRLAQWLSNHFDGPGVLERRIVSRSLDLLEFITHALQGLDRPAALDDADRALSSLRALLRVAHEVDRLSARQVLHVHTEIEQIGRQIGAWLRRMSSDSVDGRRR